MFCFYRRALLCHNLRFKTPTPSSFHLLQPFSSSSSSSASPQNQSFTINYLIDLGISPKLASKLSTQVNFNNSQNPNSVLNLFESYGFSTSQFSSIIKICPTILSFDPNKTILPKFNFLLSKGAKKSDLVHIITQNPRFLYQSLEDSITPSYAFIKSILLSDKATISCIRQRPTSIDTKISSQNVQFLLQNGVPQSKVAILFKDWYYILTQDPPIFQKVVMELKGWGFDPKTTFFITALCAKSLTSDWQRKVGMYKKWGWSKEDIVSAFLKYPWCMLASLEKIEAVMGFFVKEIGWESTLLAKDPILITLSLERRIVPRAFVLKFLESKGLIEDAKLAEPFEVTEKEFLKNFVDCFKEEASQLLKLYEENKDTPNRALKKVRDQDRGRDVKGLSYTTKM
jgi:mTERF domain-containing protein